MKTKAEKNISIELDEKIQSESGCPLCSMIMDFEFNYIAKIQFEVTNDERARESIAEEGGFCDFHFRQFKKIASGKTNIRLLKSIIDAGAFRRKDFQIICSVCKYVGEFETGLLKYYSEFLLESENRKKLEKMNGICSVHMKNVINLISDEDIKVWLHKTYAEQIERMKSDFDSMDKVKSFYEIDLKKRKLINILIEKLAGRKTRSL